MVEALETLKPNRRSRLPTIRGSFYRAWEGTKAVDHRIRRRTAPEDQTILLVIGCQRSGTDMLCDVFSHDPQTRVFGEVSKLTADDPIRQLRLNEWTSVQADIGRTGAPVVVVKPLVESQHAPELLDTFPNSKVIWAVRDYQDVAASIIAKWGIENSMRDLRHVAERRGTWRDEHVSEETRAIIAGHLERELTAHDAAALFWYLRNRTILDRLPAPRSRVTMWHYSQMVERPRDTMRSLYAELDLRYPGDLTTFRVTSSSVGRGRDVSLSPDIESRCAELLTKLQNW